MIDYSQTPADLAGLLSTIARMSPAKAARVARAFPRGSLSGADASKLLAAGCTANQAGAILAALSLAQALDGHAADRVGPAQRSPADMAGFMQRRIGSAEQEHFAIVMLDARQRPIKVQPVGLGTLSQVDVHPRAVFREAIRLAVHSVILCHNHPSGDAAPSEADIELTRRMVEVGRLVGIPVLDHLIVTRTDHTSLAALGLLPT